MQPIQSYTTEAMAEKNNLIVYCEYDEGRIADVSLELLTKGRVLADRLGVKLEAVVLGDKLEGIESRFSPTAPTLYTKSRTNASSPIPPIPMPEPSSSFSAKSNRRFALWVPPA